jgi:hypothetical protein
MEFSISLSLITLILWFLVAVISLVIAWRVMRALERISKAYDRSIQRLCENDKAEALLRRSQLTERKPWKQPAAGDTAESAE